MLRFLYICEQAQFPAMCTVGVSPKRTLLRPSDLALEEGQLRIGRRRVILAASPVTWNASKGSGSGCLTWASAFEIGGGRPCNRRALRAPVLVPEYKFARIPRNPACNAACANCFALRCSPGVCLCFGFVSAAFWSPKERGNSRSRLERGSREASPRLHLTQSERARQPATFE